MNSDAIKINREASEMMQWLQSREARDDLAATLFASLLEVVM